MSKLTDQVWDVDRYKFDFVSMLRMHTRLSTDMLYQLRQREVNSMIFLNITASNNEKIKCTASIIANNLIIMWDKVAFISLCSVQL